VPIRDFRWSNFRGLKMFKFRGKGQKLNSAKCFFFSEKRRSKSREGQNRQNILSENWSSAKLNSAKISFLKV